MLGILNIRVGIFIIFRLSLYSVLGLLKWTAVTSVLPSIIKRCSSDRKLMLAISVGHLQNRVNGSQTANLLKNLLVVLQK